MTASPTANDTVRCERRGATLLVIIDRPDARNAIDGSVAAGIAAAMDMLDGVDELRVGVLAAAGFGFSAGMDLKEFASGQAQLDGPRGFAGIVERPPRKPVIAAVHGFAVAGGLEVALACDLIIAEEGAKLGIPEVTLGLFAGGGALRRLPERIGLGAAMRLALTGSLIEASEAVELGLVDVVVPKGQALSAALALAERIEQNGPLAVEATKALLKAHSSLSETEFWATQNALRTQVFASDDAHEGSTAFAERRAPIFRGE